MTLAKRPLTPEWDKPSSKQPRLGSLPPLPDNCCDTTHPCDDISRDVVPAKPVFFETSHSGYNIIWNEGIPGIYRQCTTCGLPGARWKGTYTHVSGLTPGFEAWYRRSCAEQIWRSSMNWTFVEEKVLPLSPEQRPFGHMPRRELRVWTTASAPDAAASDGEGSIPCADPSSPSTATLGRSRTPSPLPEQEVITIESDTEPEVITVESDTGDTSSRSSSPPVAVSEHNEYRIPESELRSILQDQDPKPHQEPVIWESDSDSDSNWTTSDCDPFGCASSSDSSDSSESSEEQESLAERESLDELESPREQESEDEQESSKEQEEQDHENQEEGEQQALSDAEPESSEDQDFSEEQEFLLEPEIFEKLHRLAEQDSENGQEFSDVQDSSGEQGYFEDHYGSEDQESEEDQDMSDAGKEPFEDQESFEKQDFFEAQESFEDHCCSNGQESRQEEESEEDQDMSDAEIGTGEQVTEIEDVESDSGEAGSGTTGYSYMMEEGEDETALSGSELEALRADMKPLEAMLLQAFDEAHKRWLREKLDESMEALNKQMDSMKESDEQSWSILNEARAQLDELREKRAALK